MDLKEINDISSRILYEDNHIIAVNKKSSEIVQKDKTGDKCLIDLIKEFIKNRDNKKGNVYLGLPHRIDRPTSGIVIFAKTDKALSRISNMFKNGEVNKTYLTLTDSRFDKDSDKLIDYMLKNEKQNKSYVVKNDVKGAKKAILEYQYAGSTNRYFLYEVHLLTGRHHQIRCQFAIRGVHIKGDLKYGAKRSNEDGSICLHSYKVEFIHPVSKKEIKIISYPTWKGCDELFIKLKCAESTNSEE